MAGIKTGDNFPEGIAFSYVPFHQDTGPITTSGTPISYDASKGE